MKVYRTAGITAVWRSMANADGYSIKNVNPAIKIFAHILGFLDKNSVATIAQRTRIIDSIIKKSSPKCVVEIGAGFSCRQARFKGIKFYEFDLPYFQKFKKDIIPFEIGKDELNLKIKNALFIVEGVTMYLNEPQVLSLLSQIKKYRGSIIIDFFERKNPPAKKSMREKIYKALFRLIIERDHLFDYRIENAKHGTLLLKGMGYRNVKHYNYKIPKTLDVLFYGEL